ncbi:1-phosphofructokinase family hexose kinase [Scopulibacillus cellulosilyticus]|uniref:Tagatose-6-phosphate kinase n=1 Tax=Scopulibacillus cellulosilyticus TaxID=2665665 RepID=A0ABW2PWJ8_9BACL
MPLLTINLNPAIDTVYRVKSFNANEINRIHDVVKTAGGKGNNVARVAKSAGEEVYSLCFLGGGNGKWISSQLTEAGIYPVYEEIAGNTRTCIAVINERDNSITELLEPGPVISEKQQNQLLERLAVLTGMKAFDCITLSGSIPKGITDEWLDKLFAKLCAFGIPFIVDTSDIRLIDLLHHKPTVIKPNIHELESWMGTRLKEDNDIIQAGRHLCRKGAEIVVVSLGEKGVLAILEGGVYKVEVPKINPLSAVGAGDALVAGLALGFIKELPLPEILRKAAGFGTAATLSYTTGSIDNSRLPLLQNQVIVKKI